MEALFRLIRPNPGEQPALCDPCHFGFPPLPLPLPLPHPTLMPRTCMVLLLLVLLFCSVRLGGKALLKLLARKHSAVDARTSGGGIASRTHRLPRARAQSLLVHAVSVSCVCVCVCVGRDRGHRQGSSRALCARPHRRGRFGVGGGHFKEGGGGRQVRVGLGRTHVSWVPAPASRKCEARPSLK